MKTIKNIAIVLILLAWLPIKSNAQTDQFEMVLEKVDGTELTFRITNDYPLLQYMYGGDEGVNTLVITSANGETTIPCPDIKRLFTKGPNFIPGDSNGDGLVNVTDIVATVNFIMEKPSDNFNKDAADLNGDGKVNVTDIVMMVSIIMSGDN
jgi:uncharacterized membrane protein YkgB